MISISSLIGLGLRYGVERVEKWRREQLLALQARPTHELARRLAWR